MNIHKKEQKFEEGIPFVIFDNGRRSAVIFRLFVHSMLHAFTIIELTEY